MYREMGYVGRSDLKCLRKRKHFWISTFKYFEISSPSGGFAEIQEISIRVVSEASVALPADSDYAFWYRHFVLRWRLLAVKFVLTYRAVI